MTVNISDDIAINSINANLGRGGWECRFTSLTETDLVVNNQRINIKWRPALGGPPTGERMALRGYTQPIRFTFDTTGSRTEFTAQTSDGFLRRAWLQGIGFAQVAARAHYHQFDAGRNMTIGRLVEHILGYYDNFGGAPVPQPAWVAHTNLVYHPTENPHGWITLDDVELAEFDPTANPDGTMRTDRYIVRETYNIWSRLQEIARTEFYVVYFDKLDNIHYCKHPMFQTVLPPVVMTFDENFCLTPPAVEIRDESAVNQMTLHAVTDEGDTMHAWFPKQNLIDNPSIEIDIAGWTNISAAVGRSIVFFHEGIASLWIVTNNAAANESAYYTTSPMAANTQFTGSAWFYQAAGGATVHVRVRDQTNGTETASAPVALAAATWTFITVDHTTGANPCVDLRLYVETDVQQNITYYADAMILSPPALPVYAKAPELSRIRCNDQDTLNEWVRRQYYFENRPYTVRWYAPGLCGLLFEILDRIQITYTGTAENGVHIDWTNKKFWIHEINVVPDATFGGRTEFLLEAENLVD